MRQAASRCRLRTQLARCTFPEERRVERSLRFQARREVLHQLAPQYRQASPSQKRTLLEAFVATTGYVPKYARWLLNHAEEVQQLDGRSHLRRYGPDVQHALFLVWHAANRICAKGLIPFLSTLIEALEGKIFGGAMQLARPPRFCTVSPASVVCRFTLSGKAPGRRGLV
jgi:hypothetical protein